MSMTYVASATILVSRFVKLSGVGTVAQQGTAGDPCVGIAQDGGRYAPVPSNTADPVEAAQSGEYLDVICPGEDRDATLLLGTGGATVGGHLMSDANGKGVEVTTGKHAGAIALETGVAGEVIRVRPILYQMP